MRDRLVLSRREVFAGCGAALTLRATTAGGLARTPVIYDDAGGLLVEASINDMSVKRLVLDTGASRSAIGARYALEIGLPLSAGDVVEGSAGIVGTQKATVRIGVAGFRTRALEVTVYDFGSYDNECVGILGSDMLAGQGEPFLIDYAKREIVWSAPRPKASIRMDLDNGIPRVNAILNGIELPFRIDTGATLSPGNRFFVNVTQDQASKVGFKGPPAMTFSAGGTGGASLSLPVYSIAEFAISGRTLGPALAIVQPKVGYFARPDAVGFLGNSVLDKLNPFLDYKGGFFGLGV